MTLEPVEKRRIGNERVLDDFGEAGAELAGRQRRQRRGVGDHGDRLVKGADQVLAGGMVHACLAADRGVDLREQRGRQLDEIDTALVAGGGEPGHVADHAPAERGDARIAVEARLDHGVEDAGHGSERLVSLSIGKSESLHALARQARPHALQIQRAHGLAGDDQHVPGVDRAAQDRRVAQQFRPDQDRILATAQPDVDPRRHAPVPGDSRPTISSTTAFTLRPSVSTQTAARSS